ncbi:unnamed protein product [Protopolystoma xenopodis]|uniref:Uncharacterized protein n=1 Tax=Protopolystoma xenopodis TaxID=117903 RepID=A0A448WTY3_9PLAT|nr:unnamed protein product [Protopolystoma xenopodis]
MPLSLVWPGLLPIEVPDLAPWDADEHHIDRSIEEAPTAPRSVEIDELSRRHLASGPRLPDPYESTEATSYLLPLLASIGTFLPILFCICKL